MALTEFSNAFSKTHLPMVPSTRPSSFTVRFLPSRMTTTSMSVVPLADGRRCRCDPRATPHIKVGRCEDDAVGIGPVVLPALQIPPEPSVTSACDPPRRCTLRYASALLPKSFQRPGPKSVSPATYCSGVAVVVR